MADCCQAKQWTLPGRIQMDSLETLCSPHKTAAPAPEGSERRKSASLLVERRRNILGGRSSFGADRQSLCPILTVANLTRPIVTRECWPNICARQQSFLFLPLALLYLTAANSTRPTVTRLLAKHLRTTKKVYLPSMLYITFPLSLSLSLFMCCVCVCSWTHKHR